MRGQLSRQVLLAAALSALAESDLPSRERIQHRPKKYKNKPRRKERKH